MNVEALIKLEKKLRKAKRSSFFCGALVLMVMMAFVIVSKIGGVPVDQEAVATAGTPIVILIALITGLCSFFHSIVKAKLRRLQL